MLISRRSQLFVNKQQNKINTNKQNEQATLTPSEAAHLFNVIRRHFTQPKFDYFDRTKFIPPPRTFAAHVVFYQKLAVHVDPLSLLVSNMIAFDKPPWINQILSETGEQTYVAWKKRTQALQYNFKQDLNKIDSSLATLLTHIDQLTDILMPETICIMHSLNGTQSKIQRLNKYTPFIKFDGRQYRKMVVEYFNDKLTSDNQ